MYSTLDFTITDGFCGAGGSTEGETEAGAMVINAINHSPLAIASHEANFQHCAHYCMDMADVDPRTLPHTTALWMSPECTNQSPSKGIKLLGQRQLSLWTDREEDPLVERSRMTMRDVVRFAAAKKEQGHAYKIVIVENVVEVRHWSGYEQWMSDMLRLGYNCKEIYLNAFVCHPTPQSRDRWFSVFWQKGNPAPDLDIRPTSYCIRCDKEIQAVQSWKQSTKRHGKYRTQYVYRCPTCGYEVMPYYHPALNAIDWSILTPRIGDRTKPLKDTTMQRIRQGLQQMCPTGAVPIPFLVETCRTYDTPRGGNYIRPILHPLATQTTRQSIALVTPPAEALIHWHRLMQEHTREKTVPFLVSYYGNGRAHSVYNPVGTLTGNDRYGLVFPGKQNLEPEECGFRVLTPEEVKRAMGFPDDYILKGNGATRIL